MNHLPRTDSSRTPERRQLAFALINDDPRWLKGCDLERAPLVPCIDCGRLMPLVIGHLGSCNLRGQAAPYVRCSPCSQKEANSLPTAPRLLAAAPSPADQAAYDLAWRKRNARFRRTVARHWPTRILPVARALLANVKSAAARRPS